MYAFCAYYRKVRRGRRVVSIYCGPDLDGLEAEYRADLEGNLRIDAACRREKEREAEARLERAIIHAVTLIDAVFKLTMGTKGFIYHHRSWRKGRPRLNGRLNMNEINPFGPDFHASLTAHRARRLFDEDPVGSLVARYGGDLAERTTEALISNFSDFWS
jgi:hypothetical protein